MKRLILLIDEDVEPMKYYVAALRTKFTVVQVSDPDEAVDYLADASKPKPDLIILDIMLPPGKRYLRRADTERGLRTGILLYQDLHALYPCLPILVLTNLASGKAEMVRTAQSVPAYEKIELAPFELVEAVEELLQ